MTVKEIHLLIVFTPEQRKELIDARSRTLRDLSEQRVFSLTPAHLFEPGQRLDDWRWEVSHCIRRSRA